MSMRIGGIASGIDTHQLISDLMRAERMPLDRMVQNRQWVDWQRDAFRDVNLALRNFQTSFESLRLQSTFNAYAANSSNESILKATATGRAVPGVYNIDVIDIAEVAKLTSIGAIKDQDNNQVSSSTRIFTAMGLDGDAPDQTFTIESQGLSATITVTQNDTFSSLATKIANAKHDGDDENNGKSLGLRASFDNTTGRFFLSTREMGGDKDITLSEDEGNNLVKQFIIGLDEAAGPGNYGNVTFESDENTSSFQVSGKYAHIVFNDIEVNNISTNRVTVHGIELNLINQGTSTVHVDSDATKVADKIKDFVEAYNALIDELQGKVNEPRYRGYPPLTDEQRNGLSEREAELWDEKAKSGLLRNDPILQSILSNLRQAFSNPVQGIASGEINHLSQIGITTTSDWLAGGKLEINEERLMAAINENPDQVMNLFTKQAGADLGENESRANYQGLGFRMQDQLNSAIRSLRSKAGAPGTIMGDQSNLGQQLTRFDQQIVQMERRLSQVEERYWAQFTAMEKAVHEMNNQSLWLTQALFGGFNG